jgi:hypothetical protein
MAPGSIHQSPLSLVELEQVSKLLTPHFLVAVQPAMLAMAKDIKEAIAQHQREMKDEMSKLESRVESLERARWKLIGAISLAAFVASVGADVLAYGLFH